MRGKFNYLLSPFFWGICFAIMLIWAKGSGELSGSDNIIISLLGHALAISAPAFIVLGIVFAIYSGFKNKGNKYVLGSARFATKKEKKALKNNHGLMVGREGKILRYAGDAHLLTIAPTRTGKGVGTIIPNLLTTDRSVICIDPKGENTKITWRARHGFGKVFVLDPFGTSGKPSASFNPLSQININGIDYQDDVAALAEALVVDAVTGDPHWNEEAKALIAGLLLNIAFNESSDRCNLLTLREYLSLPAIQFMALLNEMQNSDDANGLIARAAARQLGKNDREGASIISTAQRHTNFLDSPRMASVLTRSDFRFTDLKRNDITVFLVLPPDRIDAYSRWLRLMVTQSITDMARDATKPQKPVLYLLDEFAALGRMVPIERGMGLMAGYGVQLWPILQDTHQLRTIYRQNAGTFMANSGVLQVFGINDFETAKMISDMIGQSTISYETSATSDISSSINQHIQTRALMTPDEIMNMQHNQLLLLMSESRPLKAEKLSYYQDKEFRGLYDTV